MILECINTRWSWRTKPMKKKGWLGDIFNFLFFMLFFLKKKKNSNLLLIGFFIVIIIIIIIIK
jgi:hypothetical protein